MEAVVLTRGLHELVVHPKNMSVHVQMGIGEHELLAEDPLLLIEFHGEGDHLSGDPLLPVDHHKHQQGPVEGQEACPDETCRIVARQEENEEHDQKDRRQ